MVIAIIGILSAFLAPNYIGVRQRSRDGQRKADLSSIRSALELYRADNSSYPSTLSSCGSAFTFNGATYMAKIPCDPSGTSAPNSGSYTYRTDATTYSLIACLENGQDVQRDTALPSPNPCDQSTNFAYTLSNP